MWEKNKASFFLNCKFNVYFILYYSFTHQKCFSMNINNAMYNVPLKMPE